MRWLRYTLLLQGIYYLATGLWPVLSLSTFTAVVGPKPDVFQLNVTASLIVVIGIVLLVGSRQVERNILLLSVLSAITFIVLELIYADMLREIFWADTVVETIFVVLVGRSFLAKGSLP